MCYMTVRVGLDGEIPVPFFNVLDSIPMGDGSLLVATVSFSVKLV